MTPSPAYYQLEKHFREISALEGASSVLNWDAETMMPAGAADIRAEQLAALATIRHEKITHSHIGELLEQAEEEKSALSDWQRANLREMHHHYLHATSLQPDLVEALTKACTHCEHIWRTARKENDYESFSTLFETVLVLVREEAAAKADALGLTPYDALLDSYDPGMRMAEIDPVFAELEHFLPGLVDEVMDYQASRNHLSFNPEVQVDKQTSLEKHMITVLGFDFNHGRIDISAHPFCGGVPGDIRLTTRYNEKDFRESLFSALHETGHALYEMGLPEQWHMQPVGRARGMSMHESQSLLVEMQLCRGKDFIGYLLPLLKKHYGTVATDWSEETILQNITRVTRSLIRVNADEVTYPLHVMLRYDLEKALLDGSLNVADLPGAWDEKMQTMLGIRPDCIGNGCMQDIHWPGGAIGYFPTYTLGAMIAAQLFASAKAVLPELSEMIRRGEFSSLFGWLRTHVHGKASFHSAQELLKEVTGQALNPQIYKAHLEQRYLPDKQ